MKVSSKEILRKLFGDYYLYLMLLISIYNENRNDEIESIINRLKETNEEIAKYIKMKIKIKLNIYLNKYLDIIITIIKNFNGFKEKEEEYKEKLLNIIKEISLLLSSKKLEFIYKTSIKFLFKALNSKLDNNYKKEIEYYDNYINSQIKIGDIIYKLILNNKNKTNKTNKKKKGGCKLFGDITCRCK